MHRHKGLKGHDGDEPDHAQRELNVVVHVSSFPSRRSGVRRDNLLGAQGTTKRAQIAPRSFSGALHKGGRDGQNRFTISILPNAYWTVFLVPPGVPSQ